MTTINQLTAVDAVASGDQVPVYDASNGDARKASLAVVQAYMQANLTFPTLTTQLSSPSATDFSVQITDGSASIHLILTPAATYADGTIVLPAVANCIDKQEILVNCTQEVTALVITGNGATVTGEPSALSALDFFKLKYDLSSQVWYRVG